MGKLLLHTNKHLESHYSSLPPLTDEQIRFLDRFDSDDLGERVIRVLVDHHQMKVLYAKNTELLHVPAEEWSIPLFLSLLFGAYSGLYSRVAHAAYRLHHKHRLSRHGVNIYLQSSLPIADAKGKAKYYHANRISRGVVYDLESGISLLTATEFRLSQDWDPDQAPVPFRPMLFLSEGKEVKRLTAFENELVKSATEGFVETEMGMTPEWLLVWQGHLDGLTNGQIASKTGLPSTKVNYYNTCILALFQQQFSGGFENVKSCAKYWKKQVEQIKLP